MTTIVPHFNMFTMLIILLLVTAIQVLEFFDRHGITVRRGD